MTMCMYTHTHVYTDKCSSHPHLLPTRPPVDISSYGDPPLAEMQRPSNHVYSPNWYIYLQHSRTAPQGSENSAEEAKDCKSQRTKAPAVK